MQYQVLHLLAGTLDLLLLDRPRFLPGVAEGLQDGIEPQLLLKDVNGGPALDCRHCPAEGPLGALGLLVGVEGVVPLLHLLLGESQQHPAPIKL
jgi:hypothetical protein